MVAFDPTKLVICLWVSELYLTIGFVSSLFGYLMYYKRKQIETNTNKVIMTKIYGVSGCIIICVVSCCVIICVVNIVST